MIKYIKGDIFELMPKNKNVLLPHVCNCKNGFGSGFVIPLKKNYPIVAEKYHSMFPEKLNKLGYNQYVKINDDLTVVNMVAQTLGGKRPLNYGALVACMTSLLNEDKFLETSHTEIHTVMFGSALAGGNWDFIEQLIQDIWLTKDVPVTVYWRDDNMPNSIKCYKCNGTGQDLWVGHDGYREPINCERCKTKGYLDETCKTA